MAHLDRGISPTSPNLTVHLTTKIDENKQGERT